MNFTMVTNKKSGTISTLEKFEEPSLNDFHLQFVNSNRSDDYSSDVDTFLRKVYTGLSPLEYQAHQVIQQNGRAIAKVRFKCSQMGISKSIPLESAGRDLCNRIFQPESRRWLSLVTTESIIGVSAACNQWQQWFNRAFFTASLNRGPSMLQEISNTFCQNYLPEWVLVLGFSVLAGWNFGVFVTDVIQENGIAALFGPAGAKIAGEILERFALCQSAGSREVCQRTWAREHEKFKTTMAQSSQVLDRYQDALMGRTINNVDDLQSPEEQVCETLYKMAESAAIMITCNKDMLIAFKKARVEAEGQIALGGAGIGLSLWAGYSAFWTATATTAEILPLASWGLGEVLGLAMFVEVPFLVTTTTTLWWCPPVAIAAGAGAVVCSYAAWKKRKEAQRYNEKVKYHEGVKDYIGQVWGLAQDTQRFLQWVHCTNTTQLSAIEFVDNSSQHHWQEFVVAIRQVTNQEPTAADMSPQFVATYLGIQRKTLENAAQAMSAQEKKMST